MSRTSWIVVALVSVLIGAGLWQASRPAPELTPQSGGHVPPPDTSAIAEGAPIVQVSLPETLSPDAQVGQRAFDAVCAACHGQNAAGQKVLPRRLSFAPTNQAITPTRPFNGRCSTVRARITGISATCLRSRA